MKFRTTWIAVLLILTASGAVLAQTGACMPTTDTPPDLNVKLALANGRTEYQEGEMILMRLEFAASTPGTYFIDTRNYDRSGRIMIDTMCLEPDTADPLTDYFDSGLFGFIGGGIGGQAELKTHQISLELNEWKSLPPGGYRLRVVSHRVSKSTPQDRLRASIGVPVASNAVEFRVGPAGAGWQASELTAAREELDATGDPARSGHAARVLRFLGSEAAAEELARRFYSLEQPHGWDLMFGLVASPHRARAIRSLHAAIADPEHPITGAFLRTLALLEIQSDPHRKLPPYKANDPEWKSSWEAKRDEYDRLVAQHIEELAAALGSKSAQTRGLSIETVLTSAPPKDPAARASLRQRLIASWDSLPGRTRNELIQYRWDEIRGPEMLPVLRRIVNEPATRSSPDNVERGPALRRLYELSPVEGRELILREILDGRGDIWIDVLGMLPDSELPQIEAPILSRLRQGAARDTDYRVIERYGSARIFDDVKAIFQEHVGRWACDPQAAMLRYLLRIDPAYGASAVAEALTHRDATGCYRMTLSDVGDALQRPAVQTIAFAALDDASYDVVRDAAEALGRYGSADAESKLWQRLRDFHAAWKDKDTQLRFAPGKGREDMAPAGAESALVHAIATGQSWLCGVDRLESLRQLVSSERRAEVDRMIRQWQDGPMQLHVDWSPTGRFSYMIAYMSGNSLGALTQKLQQLPAQTELVSIIRETVYNTHAEEMAQIESAAAAAGLVLNVQKTR